MGKHPWWVMWSYLITFPLVTFSGCLIRIVLWCDPLRGNILYKLLSQNYLERSWGHTVSSFDLVIRSEQVLNEWIKPQWVILLRWYEIFLNHQPQSDPLCLSQYIIIVLPLGYRAGHPVVGCSVVCQNALIIDSLELVMEVRAVNLGAVAFWTPVYVHGHWHVAASKPWLRKIYLMALHWKNLLHYIFFVWRRY